MKGKLFLSGGGSAAQLAQRYEARRGNLRLVRSNRERHAFADPRVQLVDGVLEHRLRAA